MASSTLIPLSGRIQTVTTSLTGTQDIHRFSYNGSGSIQMYLYGLSQNLDLELFRDDNGNGFDSSDTRIDILYRFIQDPEAIESPPLFKESGDYYAVVKGINGSNYKLDVVRTINARPFVIFNPPLGAIIQALSMLSSISEYGSNEFVTNEETIEFSTRFPGRLDFSFSNNDVNVLQLFSDSNNNSIFDSQDSNIKNAFNSNSLTVDVNQGTFFLRLSGPALNQSSGVLSIKPSSKKNSDFNADGKNDIVVQNQAAGWAGVWGMNGNAVASWSGLVSTDGTSASTSGAKIVGVGDFNGDGKNDIVLQNQAAGWAGIWGMNGSTVTSWNGLPSTSGGNIVGVGDFNGDGKNDLVIQNQAAGWAGIWGMNGTAVTSWSGLVSTDGTSASTSGAKIVGVGDFNGDGKNDIVLQNQAAGWAGIWGMNGSTVTSWIGLPSTSGGNIVGVGDFNSDGKNDLVLQGAGWAGIWTMNGSSVTGWAGLPSTSGGSIVV